MINENVINTFTKVCKETKLSRLDNGDDLVIYPNISDEYLVDAIDNFKIDKDETVLYFRDTSHFNRRNQGLVITDLGIILIHKAKNGQRLRIYWSEVKPNSFDYTAQRIYYETNSIDRDEAISIDDFLKDVDNDDDYNKFGTILVNLFNSMTDAAQEVSGYSGELRDEVEQLTTEKKYSEAIAKVTERLEVTYSPKEQGLLYGALAKLYYLSDEIEKAQTLCERSHELCTADSDGYIYSIYLLYKIYMRKSMILEARRKCFTILNSSCDIQLKNEAQKDFTFLESYINEHFTDIPYSERKVIMPVRNYVDIDQESFSVIDIKKLSNLEFPVGHPIPNQLYVGHPLIPEMYIPFEDYQLEFVEDKVREFCLVAQSLGATDISIECKNTGGVDDSFNRARNIGGNFEATKIGVDASYDSTYSHHLVDELNKNISLHQTFTPQSTPYLPKDLVWYQSQPSWQRLYKQRIDGGLTSHQERIETNKSQVVEDNEMLSIKAGVKYLVGKLNLNYTQSDDLKFQKQENAVLIIDVKFAPLSEILNNQVSKNKVVQDDDDDERSVVENIAEPVAKKVAPTVEDTAPVVEDTTPTVEDTTPAVEDVAPAVENTTEANNSHLNIGTPKEEEADYVNLLKEIYEDGTKSSTEKRLIERIRVHSGISEERAQELETLVKSSVVTSDEKEYIEEYKAALTNGEIPEAERMMLDKLAEMLNISAERVKELEKMN